MFEPAPAASPSCARPRSRRLTPERWRRRSRAWSRLTQVDVVDTDARAADRPEAHRPAEQLEVQLVAERIRIPSKSPIRFAAPSRTLSAQATAGGYRWLADELDDVVAVGGGGPRTERGRLLDVYARNEPWMRALDALERLAAAPTPAPTAPTAAAKPGPALRLAWVLALRGSHCEIRPVEQKRDARGRSRRHALALQRLYDDAARMTHLEDQDRRILASLTATTYRSHGYPGTTYTFRHAGRPARHARTPHVYLEEDPPARVDLVEGGTVLEVARDANGVVLRLVPVLAKDQGVGVVRESPTRARVVFPSVDVLRYAEVLGDGLRVPLAEQDRIAEAARAAVVGGRGAVSARRTGPPCGPVEPHSAPVVPVADARPGLAVRLLVRPFRTCPRPHFAPGAGAATVIAEIAGERVQTHRSLARETTEAARLRRGVPDAGPLARRTITSGSSRRPTRRWSC